MCQSSRVGKRGYCRIGLTFCSPGDPSWVAADGQHAGQHMEQGSLCSTSGSCGSMRCAVGPFCQSYGGVRRAQVHSVDAVAHIDFLGCFPF